MPQISPTNIVAAILAVKVQLPIWLSGLAPDASVQRTTSISAIITGIEYRLTNGNSSGLTNMTVQLVNANATGVAAISNDTPHARTGTASGFPLVLPARAKRLSPCYVRRGPCAALHHGGMCMIAAEIARGARRDAPVIAICIGYVAVMSVLFAAYGLPFLKPESYLANFLLYASAVFVMIALVFLWSLLRIRPDSPFAFVPHFARQIRLGERLLPSLPVVCAFAIFMPAFSQAKTAIPFFNPYHHDQLFTRMDVWIHGTDAWRLIHPLVGHPFASFAINTLYHFWILLLYMGMPLVCGWLAQPSVRLQFLLAYALCWIVLGTILAIALSSVGPCFVEYFYGDRSYRPLMDYLAQADRQWPLMALDVQKTLIEWRQADSHGLGRGISAMPSMHVSIATLFAILGWRHSRALGIALTLFLLLIMIGSIHLGYHYAVDGYLSMALTPILWAISGIAARRWTNSSANRSR